MQHRTVNVRPGALTKITQKMPVQIISEVMNQHDYMDYLPSTGKPKSGDLQ